MFERQRSNVDSHLYDDSLPLLDWIRRKSGQRVKLSICSNSNAYLDMKCELGRRLDFYINAAEIGAAKPSAVPFLVMCQKCRVCPTRVLYIGDSFHHDIIGASSCGMKSAYLQRQGVVDGTYSKCQESHMHVKADIVLSSLDVEEFCSKLSVYFSS